LVPAKQIYQANHPSLVTLEEVISLAYARPGTFSGRNVFLGEVTCLLRNPMKEASS